MAEQKIIIGQTVKYHLRCERRLREAIVMSIDRTRNPHEKFGGRAVLSIPFSEREYALVYLSDNHWCFGDQITKILT